MNKNIFITTTLPYCNGNMHVGAAFEFILADSLNRYLKSNGYNTYLNIGLDQNGSKILSKSKELNIPVKEYIKNTSEIWIDSCDKLNIKYDNFYQTSTEEHYDKAKNIWNYFINNGDIYLKEYTGKYCVGCESFKLEKDLIDNKCPEHPSIEIQLVSEENYFFNLKKYKSNLLKWLETNPIYPSNKINELIGFINDYEELSVSRKETDFTFGVKVPDCENQIIYVWLDALSNYFISADNWIGWNNCDIIQLYGVDNNRFQAQIYQCFLSAMNYKNSDKMFIHGTILDSEGRKMSKTLGNVVDPIEQLDKYGIEALRYYILAGLNTTENSSWDEDKLVSLYNSEVCNEFGNLVSRVLHLIDTKLEKTNDSTLDFKNYVDNFIIDINHLWKSLNINEALKRTNELVKYANKYINDEKPWSNDNFEEILNNLYYLILEVCNIYYYVFPNKEEEIRKALSEKKKVILFNKLILKSL